jgi:hypothetical protein
LAATGIEKVIKMKTIAAIIPAVTRKAKNGQVFKNPARTDIFNQDGDGQWTNGYGEYCREADVIHVCQQAANWQEIRAAHFPMQGFHN